MDAAPLMRSLSLVAPCLNEEGNLRELVERFFRCADERGLDVEVVLVDDGSTDSTWAVMNSLLSERGSSVVLVRHATNRGIPQGWLSGIQLATGRAVCLIDADLQNPPEVAFDLYDRFIVGDCDLVRAVRIPVSKSSRSRIMMSKTLNSILNVVFAMRSLDNKSGFVLASHQTISEVVHHRGQYRHFQTFIGVATHSRGFKVVEIDTPFEDRRSGFSFLTGRSWSVILDVLRDLSEARREFGWRFGKRSGIQ